MSPLSSRTLRYARAWIATPEDVAEDEIRLDRDGTMVPATLVRPRSPGKAAPAWVVMHGITRPGRAHLQLVRFTRAVASAGLATIVPEVPEWRRLSLAPHLSAPTIAAAIRGLRDTGVVRDEPVGVIGFSFGAPHTIAACGAPGLEGQIAGACGFGGYCSLETTFRFMMTGRHGWDGARHDLRPDPYGRWIAAANYLTGVPDHEDAEDVADALLRLAAHAGDVGAPSWNALYDPTIRELRAEIAEPRRQLFDLFARPSDSEAIGADADGLAEGLAAAARQADPLIDPADALGAVRCPVHVLHGRGDNLIPFTEAFRLAEALRNTDVQLTVTRLFGHSGQGAFPVARALREVPRFARALDRILTIV
jgi:pimeloyl-ACP methyl ester carboxylesterase